MPAPEGGVMPPNAEKTTFEKSKEEKSMSGIAAMELSRYAKDGAMIIIDFLPQTGAAEIEAMLK